MKDLEKLFDNTKKPSFKYKKRKTKRTVIKLKGKLPDNAVKGKITEIIGTSILVKSDTGQIFECVTGGIVISKNENQSIVAAGDIIYFLPDEKPDLNPGTIVKIEKRRNHFSRKEVGYQKEHVIASNVDKLVILMSAKSPKYNKRLIDRFLVTAELNMIEPIICINKIDLIDENKLKKYFLIYKKSGIKNYFVSAKYKTGLNEIISEMQDNTTVLSGPSGAGKSTLLNAILGSNYQAIQEISDKTNKGKHTTSAVSMFTLPDGGDIIDTPGIREFGIWGLKKDELALYFHEFDEFNPNCKYYPCTHTHEPGCAVIEAVEKGDIDFERYESYLNIYDTLE